jgi:transcription initiation factor TFIID subunit TAF12
MTPLNDEKLMARIALSDLKEKYDKFIAVKDDPTAKQNVKGIAQSMFEEMEDGILRGATYACQSYQQKYTKHMKKQQQQQQQQHQQHQQLNLNVHQVTSMEVLT